MTLGSNPHRVPGEVDARSDVEPLHRGPRDACPFCAAKARRDDDGRYTSASALPAPVACESPWWRPWRGCAAGPHLHQRCAVCGGAWVCAPALQS